MSVAYLTEKHTQAVILAQALGRYDPSEKSRGYYSVGSNYIVWCVGHLFRLLEPEEYSPDLKTWSFDTLPLPIDQFRYSLDVGSSNGRLKAGQFKAIQSLVKMVDRFVIATDDDREGEVIGRQALEFAGWKGSVGRLVYGAVDVATFKKALAKERNAAEFDGRYKEGLTRGIADFVIGMEVTRASHLAFDSGERRSLVVTAGRVQSPVINMIASRCEAITGFVPQTYFTPFAKASVGGTVITFGCEPEPHIFEEREAQALSDRLSSEAAVTVEKHPKSRKPPKLFNSNSLFAAAAHVLDWDSAKTLSVANSLYLAGHILYPRSDCVYLPEAYAGDAGLLLDRLGQVPEICPKGSVGILQAGFKARSEIYNDKKVTAHTAIIPNANGLRGRQVDLGALSEDERQLYILIAKRFITAHLPDEQFLMTVVTLAHPDGAKFVARSKTVTSPGWRSFADAAQEDEDPQEDLASLPEGIETGDISQIVERGVSQKQTRPPAWFTEASLGEALERHGFGTPATFADHIRGLRDRQYIGGTVKKIVITPRGAEVVKGHRATIPELLSPEMTASIEQKLAAIAEGREEMSAVIREIRTLSARWVDALRNAPAGIVDVSKISVCRPPTAKVKALVRSAGQLLGVDVPRSLLSDAAACSDFLDKNKEALDVAFSRPTEAMISLAKAIKKGNPALELTDEMLESRDAVSSFIEANKDATLPPSDKQIDLVRRRAAALEIAVPESVLKDARKLSIWLDEHPVKPSAKQLQLARKLASDANKPLPDECTFNADKCGAFIDQHIRTSKKGKKAS